MRIRDPNHDKRLKAVLAAPPDQCKQWIQVQSYKDPDFIASEVLASLIRVRFGAEFRIYEAATAALHRRVLMRIAKLARTTPEWQGVIEKVDKKEFIKDAAQYFWLKFLANTEEVCNAEVKFKVYLDNRVTDYVRHLMKKKNSAPSLETQKPVRVEKGEKKERYENTVPDPRGDITYRSVEAEDEKRAFLASLPDKQRHAIYLRDISGHDWDIVAELMDCSVPTARKHYTEGKEKAPKE